MGVLRLDRAVDVEAKLGKGTCGASA